METLIVTARLRNGFAASDPWSPSIDGILAYWMLREQLGEAAFTAGAADPGSLHPVEGLPLERIEHQGLWWYACSSPIYDEVAQSLRYYHRRFDARAAERYADVGRRVDVKSGPYKSSRLSQVVHTCAAVQWHVMGDADRIRHLLRRCAAIGAKINTGFGAVAEWTVSPGGEAEIARRRRPLPADYASQHGIEGPVMRWAIRPPSRLRGNQTECVMPDEIR